LVSVTMKELLEAGVHFGHRTKRWNPKMKDFIFGKRNGIYIIDLQKTIKIFREATEFIETIAAQGKDILIVGTKKQAQDIVKDYALQCEACYVDQRWLGGLLTNNNVIRGSVDKLKELEEMKEDGRWDLLSKKDQSKQDKVFKKLSKNLGGVKNMKGMPGALIVIDSKLGIPIVAVVDTNADPDGIDYPIPGNDDAVRAIELFTSKLSEAIMEGKKKRIEKELVEAKQEEEEALKAEAEETEEDKSKVPEKTAEEILKAGKKVISASAKKEKPLAKKEEKAAPEKEAIAQQKAAPEKEVAPKKETAPKEKAVAEDKPKKPSKEPEESEKEEKA